MDSAGPPGYDFADLVASEVNTNALADALQGAQIDLANSEGDTLLHLAARKGCKAAVELILSLGADPLRRNQKNRTPGNQAKLRAEIKDLLGEAETKAKEVKRDKASNLWDVKMKATQTESAFGVRVV
ncbi:hypothetical protein WJX74_001687 [Apatococcus lobatus]|uniref:Ankyrin repeat domain-containing protein n=2 Tax=Apatococcus TaxID=904362 RepID=A0AAW1T5K8_9CHLO